MKPSILFALLAATMATPALAQDEAFEMFGLKTTDVYSGEIEIAGKKCEIKPKGRKICVRHLGTLIGETYVDSFTTVFEDGKLLMVRGVAITNNYFKVRASFAAKYGEPDETSDETWQNRMGASFDNVVDTWRFSDGVLELRARGDTIDSLRFQFVAADNFTESPPPPVNF